MEARRREPTIKADDIPKGAYKLGLLATTMIWGGSFVVLKDTLSALPPSWLLAIRFMLAGLITTVLFWRRLRANLDGSHLLAGTIIGVTGGAAYLVQNIGLVTTTPAKNAFLTATYCAMVPFVYWAIGRGRPRWNNLAAAALCVCGTFLVTLGGAAGGIAGFRMGEGDVLSLVGAFFFAVNIVAISVLAPAHDELTLSVVQLYVFGLFSAVAALVLGEPVPTAATFTPEVLAKLAYVILLATVFAIIMQNMAQARVESAQAALLMSFESVFGVVFSIIFYHEQVTLAMLAGFAAIFAAILVSELAGRPRETEETLA
ncbi:MAG: DMT family transporter [Olegusella sp.]|nr:DMT family transporter [Olegusella sp.]